MTPHPTAVRRRLLLGMLAPALLAGGCTWNPMPRAQGPIHARDPQRDTERARRLNAQAVAALRDHNDSHAADLLAQALQADPLFSPALNNLGTLHFRQQHFYQAAAQFQQAASLAPRRPEPLSNLGLVMESVAAALTGESRLAKLDEAVAFHTRALELSPATGEYQGNLARARLARGLRDDRTRELLTALAQAKGRDGWADWARQQLPSCRPGAAKGLP